MNMRIHLPIFLATYPVKAPAMIPVPTCVKNPIF